MHSRQGGASVAAFGRGSRSYSSLPRQLPSSVNVPYGYKMDLDFVRFCNTFYDGSGAPRSPLRRTRRSHKKSYDTLLGLHGHDEKKDRPKPVRRISPPRQRPTQPPVQRFPLRSREQEQPDNRLACDLERSLGQVVSDFEDTLHRSRVKVNGGAAYHSDSGAADGATLRRYHSLPRNTTVRFARDVGLQRSPSNSSLSDYSTAEAPRPTSSVDYAREMAETIASLRQLSEQEDPPAPRARAEVTLTAASGQRPGRRSSAESRPLLQTARHEKTETITRVVDRVSSAARATSGKEASGNPAPHDDSRQQNDGKDQRLRELEEQVKAIPMLKHKLSVLREEKRALEVQMRARGRRATDAATPAQPPSGVSPPLHSGAAVPISQQLGTAFPASPPHSGGAVPASLRARSLSPSPAADAPTSVRRVQQDASTSCRVLTRDIGVCGGPLRTTSGTFSPRDASSPPRGRCLTREAAVTTDLAPHTERHASLRTVGIVTDLNSGPPERGRRKISLESILSGKGCSRTVATNTSPTRRKTSADGSRDSASVKAEERAVSHAQQKQVSLVSVNAGSQTRPPSQVSSATTTEPPPRTRDSQSATDPPPRTRDNHSATDPAPRTRDNHCTTDPPPVRRDNHTATEPRPVMHHIGVATAAFKPAPVTRDVGLTTELTIDELRSSEELRMQVEDLHSQLDELRQLHRSSRCSSETRDTFTQIKEYDLGVNYTRGAFAFHTSSSRGVQTDVESVKTRSVGAEAQLLAPPAAVPMRTFAAQVRPAVATAATQCRLETESRGSQARPDCRDAAAEARERLQRRSVASATDPAQGLTVTSGQVGQRRGKDVATGTVPPSVVSRAVVTDKPRETLKKLKSTMTDVTPLRSVASGEHVISRHQSCQTTVPATDSPRDIPPQETSLTPPSNVHQSTQTDATSEALHSPLQERLSLGRESPLPPTPRSNASSRIPRLTSPLLARKASPQGPALLTRAASDLSAGSVSPPTSVRRSPGTTNLPRATFTPPTPRRAGGVKPSSGVRSTSTTPPGYVRREKSAPVLTSPRHATAGKQTAVVKPSNKSTAPLPVRHSGSQPLATPATAHPPVKSAAFTPQPAPSSLSLTAAELAVSTPPPKGALEEPQQLPTVSAEPKQRLFGRRNTYVARPEEALELARDERGQGDRPARRMAPLADEEDTFSSDEERIAAECRAEQHPSPALEPRVKVEPSAEMRAALRVLLDAQATRRPSPAQTAAAADATAGVQTEWFRVAGTKVTDPHIVEDYLDVMETMSPLLLSTVVNMADNNLNTAMHYAVSHGNFDVVSVLLDSRACDVQRQNAAGYTCIMLLSLAPLRTETHRQVVRRLFQSGDVNIRAKQHGQTALMLAVSHGRVDMVNLLLEAGADVNIQDDDGSTSLMCASEHGHLEIVRLLLAHPDCDTQLTDNDGCTALQVAMEAGHRDVGLLLYAHSNFSRGGSPYGSLRVKRGSSRTSTSTPTGRASATPPRTPTSTPALGRRSHSTLH